MAHKIAPGARQRTKGRVLPEREGHPHITVLALAPPRPAMLRPEVEAALAEFVERRTGQALLGRGEDPSDTIARLLAGANGRGGAALQ